MWTCRRCSSDAAGSRKSFDWNRGSGNPTRTRGERESFSRPTSDDEGGGQGSRAWGKRGFEYRSYGDPRDHPWTNQRRVWSKNQQGQQQRGDQKRVELDSGRAQPTSTSSHSITAVAHQNGSGELSEPRCTAMQSSLELIRLVQQRVRPKQSQEQDVTMETSIQQVTVGLRRSQKLLNAHLYLHRHCSRLESRASPTCEVSSGPALAKSSG